MCCLGWHAWQQVPGFPSVLCLHRCTSHHLPIHCRRWQLNNLLQKHQWRIHALNIHLWKYVVQRLNLQWRHTHEEDINTLPLSLPHTHTRTVAPPHARHHSGHILHWVESLMRQAVLWSSALPSGAFKEASHSLSLSSLHRQLAHIANWTTDTR